MNKKNEQVNNQEIFPANKDDLIFRYNSIANWIKAADSKVSISIAIIGIISSSLLGFSVRNLSLISESILRKVALYFIVLSVTFLFLTIVACLLVFTPRLFTFSKNEKDNTNLSTIFYGDIARLNQSEFKNIINNLDDNQFIEQLIDNILINSKICTTKMRTLKYASWLMLLTTFLSSITFLITLF